MLRSFDVAQSCYQPHAPLSPPRRAQVAREAGRHRTLQLQQNAALLSEVAELAVGARAAARALAAANAQAAELRRAAEEGGGGGREGGTGVREGGPGGGSAGGSRAAIPAGAGATAVRAAQEQAGALVVPQYGGVGLLGAGRQSAGPAFQAAAGQQRGQRPRPGTPPSGGGRLVPAGVGPAVARMAQQQAARAAALEEALMRAEAAATAQAARAAGLEALLKQERRRQETEEGREEGARGSSGGGGGTGCGGDTVGRGCASLEAVEALPVKGGRSASRQAGIPGSGPLSPLLVIGDGGSGGGGGGGKSASGVRRPASVGGAPEAGSLHAQLQARPMALRPHGC
jgi:colicin import membrane protein